MTTNTDLLNTLAAQIPYDPSASLAWIIRGELGSDEVETDKSLIAVLHLIGQNEVVQGNFTLALDCALSGQVIIGTATISEIKKEVEKLYNSVALWLKEFRYTEVLEGVVIEGKPSGNLESGVDGLYYTFTIPFTLIVQY